MAFMEQLKKVLDNRVVHTENGAPVYATTGSALVDLNFAAASFRNKSEESIIRQFIQAFYEDKMLAMKWLFFLRDIRGGLGERRSFRVILHYLAGADAVLAKKLVSLVAEYGRFDDLFSLFDTPAEEEAISYIAKQLLTDVEAMEKGESVL